jgi:hypothetical protein
MYGERRIMSTSIKADQEEYRRLLAGHLATHQFPTSEAAVFGLHAALECIYDPRPGFWAGLELETLIQAFVSQVPILRADEIFDWGDSFRDEVERHLYLRRFDELRDANPRVADERETRRKGTGLSMVDG